jgi:hypothetical protein
MEAVPTLRPRWFMYRLIAICAMAVELIAPQAVILLNATGMQSIGVLGIVIAPIAGEVGNERLVGGRLLGLPAIVLGTIDHIRG